MRYRAFCLIGLIVFMSACDMKADNSDEKTGGKFSPVETVNPTKFIRIYGSKNPTIGLRFFVGYRTHNNDCLITRMLVGDAPQYHLYEAKVEDNGTNYSTLVPVDKFAPGYCQWRPDDVHFVANLSDKDLSPQPVAFGYDFNLLEISASSSSLTDERALNSDDRHIQLACTQVPDGVQDQSTGIKSTGACAILGHPCPLTLSDGGGQLNADFMEHDSSFIRKEQDSQFGTPTDSSGAPIACQNKSQEKPAENTASS